MGVSASSAAEVPFTAHTGSAGNSWSAEIPATAGKIVFSASPSTSSGGTSFGVQPVVQVQTAGGLPWRGTRTAEISLATATGAVLACDSALVTTDTGVIPFSGCRIDKPGTYTLTATSSGLVATSAAFSVSVGPSAQLRFTSSPGTTRAGAIAAVQPVVAVLDAGGNVVSSSAPVTLSLTTPAGAVLNCAANPRVATAGRASFAACRVSIPGEYTLTARSGSLLPATSVPFVVFGPAIPPLRCGSTIWMATFSWTPTPQVPTVYSLYVNGVVVRATGADGWNSYVQLNLYNLPLGSPAAGSYYVEVRRVPSKGAEVVIGNGTVVIGPDSYRTYTCGK